MKAFSKIILSMIMFIGVVAPYQASASTQDMEDIQGTSNHSYSDGSNPSVTTLDNGHILNVYEDQTSDDLLYRLGQ
ncbi:hypothetical protein [Jeotgalibacillus marinus]|uniref:Uncharacterized protein n=1 Tax=Jeotgalibacillus marinus TaxID=86667 RepID=A0ABV3Q1B0_9BACL